MEDQQFEVGNLILGLPPNDFTSTLDKLVLDKNGGVNGGPITSLIEYLTTADKSLVSFLFFIKILKFLFLEDKSFTEIWMLTYRSLCSPTILLCELSRQYPFFSFFFFFSPNFIYFFNFDELSREMIRKYNKRKKFLP